MFQAFHGRPLRLLAFLLLIGFASSVAATHASATACGNQATDIAVGGTAGFEAMEDPANTERLRATCRVRLYLHDYGWNNLPTPQARDSVLKAFAGTGPAAVELGAVKHPDQYWGNYYTKIYLRRGVIADQAHINAATTVSMDNWKTFVDGGKTVGLKVVSPVFAPNTNQWKGAPFTDPKWDDIRARASYGGGLTVDSPPSYFLSQPPDYRTFVEAELRWARNHGLQATLIMSPSISGPSFGPDAVKVLDQLTEDKSLPTFLIVENYRPLPVDPSYVNVVGSENNPNSINGVALKVVEHKF
jgi:hypothetical protein